MRNDIFMAGGTNLFTWMSIAQPPVTHAVLGCGLEIDNENGIKVAHIIRALRQKYGSSYALGLEALSLVVPKTMFPSTDEENQGLMVRHARFRYFHYIHR